MMHHLAAYYAYKANRYRCWTKRANGYLARAHFYLNVASFAQSR